MEESTIFTIATFIMMLSICLFGLFVYLVRSAKSDSAAIIMRLQRSAKKLLQMQQTNEQKFSEYKRYLKRRVATLLTPKKAPSGSHAVQTTEDLELGLPREEFRKTVPSKEVTCTLSPLLVRPAQPCHVAISLSEWEMTAFKTDKEHDEGLITEKNDPN